MVKEKCVMVCVTPQTSCKRLIEAGAGIAEKSGEKLIIISILNTSANDLDALGELYSCVEERNADMNVYFNGEPALTAAVAAKRYGARELITGFPGDGSNAFIGKVHELIPDVPIRMIDTDGTQYRIIRCTEEEIEKARASVN